MTAPLVVIAAGGTGGHMFPAQALAEEMLARGWRVTLATDARGARYAGGFPESVGRLVLEAASPSQGNLVQRISVPLRILAGVLEARRHFRMERPACVVGFGGYPALPALGAAWLMGLPRMIHEQNALLGRVNRLFARRVHRVACGTWPVTNAPAGAALVHVGNPVRRAVRELAGARFEMRAGGPLKLLVFGGSQGAAAFARLVPDAVAALPEGLRAHLAIAQQVRAGEEERVAEVYAQAGVVAELAPFFDDLPARIAAAHLVIARAGASTVAELAVIGRPAILIPYPHAMDDHQTANAAALAGAGAARVLPEAGLTAEALGDEIEGILGEPARAAAMAEAAQRVGRPGAARALAELVVELGKAGGG